MFLFKYFDLRRFVFGVTLFGYGVFTFGVNNAEATQSATVPYRILVLVLNLFLFFRIKFISDKVDKLAAVNYSQNDELQLKDNRKNSSLQNHYTDEQGLPTYKVKKNHFSINKLIIFLLRLFLLFYSIRVIHSIFISDNILAFSDKSQYVFYWFLMCLLPGINFFSLEQNSAHKYMYICWIFLVLIGIPAVLLDVNSASNQFSSFGRASTAAINPITLGHYGASLSLLSNYILLNRNINLTLTPISKNKIVPTITSLLGLLVILLSGSRGPLLALLVCVLLLLAANQFKNGISIKLWFGVLFLIVLFGSVISINVGEYTKFFERIFSTDEELDSGNTQTRGFLYDLAIKLSLEHPLIGFGLELPSGQGYPHNLFIESFLTLGVVGGVVFVIINLYAVIVSFKLLASKDSQWGWVGILYIQYMIAGCSSGSLYGVSSFWYLLFSLLAVCDSSDRAAE